MGEPRLLAVCFLLLRFTRTSRCNRGLDGCASKEPNAPVFHRGFRVQNFVIAEDPFICQAPSVQSLKPLVRFFWPRAFFRLLIRRLAAAVALLSRFGEGRLRRFAPNAPQVGLSEYNRHVGIVCAAQIRVM